VKETNPYGTRVFQKKKTDVDFLPITQKKMQSPHAMSQQREEEGEGTEGRVLRTAGKKKNGRCKKKKRGAISLRTNTTSARGGKSIRETKKKGSKGQKEGYQNRRQNGKKKKRLSLLLGWGLRERAESLGKRRFPIKEKDRTLTNPQRRIFQLCYREGERRASTDGDTRTLEIRAKKKPSTTPGSGSSARERGFVIWRGKKYQQLQIESRGGGRLAEVQAKGGLEPSVYPKRKKFPAAISALKKLGFHRRA